jgi:hypothetical protein
MGAREKRGLVTNGSGALGLRDRVHCRPMRDRFMPSGISVGSPLVLGPQLLSTFRRFSLRTLERHPQLAGTPGMERRFLLGDPSACQD